MPSLGPPTPKRRLSQTLPGRILPGPQEGRDSRSPDLLGRLHPLNFETPSTVLVACLILGFRGGGKKRGKEGWLLGGGA